jgi:hypothetical protein
MLCSRCAASNVDDFDIIQAKISGAVSVIDRQNVRRRVGKVRAEIRDALYVNILRSSSFGNGRVGIECHWGFVVDEDSICGREVRPGGSMYQNGVTFKDKRSS